MTAGRYNSFLHTASFLLILLSILIGCIVIVVYGQNGVFGRDLFPLPFLLFLLPLVGRSRVLLRSFSTLTLSICNLIIVALLLSIFILTTRMVHLGDQGAAILLHWINLFLILISLLILLILLIVLGAGFL